MSNNGGSSYARPLAGLGLVVASAGGLRVCRSRSSRGKFTETVPVTVISDRAGLVMNPDAKVKMRGVQVGSVKSIEYRPDGKAAALQLDMDPSQLHLIPSNVNVDIASSTVFGAKFVQLEAPPNPTAETLQQGQVLEGEHVTVEINTVFQQLVSVLDTIDPDQAERDARRDRPGVQRPWREVRPDADRLQRAAGRSWNRACRTWRTTSRRPCPR